MLWPALLGILTGPPLLILYLLVLLIVFDLRKQFRRRFVFLFLTSASVESYYCKHVNITSFFNSWIIARLNGEQFFRSYYTALNIYTGVRALHVILYYFCFYAQNSMAVAFCALSWGTARFPFSRSWIRWFWLSYAGLILIAAVWSVITYVLIQPLIVDYEGFYVFYQNGGYNLFMVMEVSYAVVALVLCIAFNLLTRSALHSSGMMKPGPAVRSTFIFALFVFFGQCLNIITIAGCSIFAIVGAYDAALIVNNLSTVASDVFVFGPVVSTVFIPGPIRRRFLCIARKQNSNSTITVHFIKSSG